MNAASWWTAMDAVGFQTLRVLLAVLWQSSILIGVIGLLAFGLRRRRAAVRHGLWVAAVLVAPLLPLLGRGAAWVGSPQAEIRLMPAHVEPRAEVAEVPVAFDETLEFEEYRSAPANTATVPRVATQSRVRLLDYPWALVLGGYAAGLGVVLSLVLVGLLRVHRWVREGRSVTDAGVLEVFEATRRRLGLTRGVRVLECAAVLEPMTVRTLRPVVLLPAGFARAFSDGEVRAVAIHELAHVKRNDALVLTLVSLVRAVLYFHPLLWWAAREITALAEQSADDAVLDATAEPLPYAKMLARLAEQLPRRMPATELAVGIVLTRGALLRRVQAILSEGRARATRRLLAATVLATVVSVGLAAALPLGEKEVQGESKGAEAFATTRERSPASNESGGRQTEQARTVGLADEAPMKELTPRGTIVDTDQNPIAGAQITLHRWDGVLSPALQTATTDAGGRFEFPSREEDAYYYIVIRKAPYAPTKQIVSSEGPIKATLRPAVDAWIEVHNDAGEPLQGARIATIAIRTPENTETFVRRGTEHVLGFAFTPSDDAGRLNLPPLPKGALVDVCIDHPRWAQARLTNVRVTEGRLKAVNLPRGVMTTFRFVVDSRTPMSIDGLTCETLLLAEAAGSAATLNRVPMTITGDRIEFYAHPVTYISAELRVPGVAITPVFGSLTIQPESAKELRFLVRKTVDVSGRVMRRDGTPHRGAQITGSTENVSPDGPVPGASEWAYSASAESDASGRFTISLPPGRCQVSVRAEGFVTDRDYTELEVRAEGPNRIPDFVSDKLEPVRGHVVDERGRPVSGAIVRMRHHSLLVMQPVVSDAEGSFEISLRRIPMDLDSQTRCYELDLAAFIADRPLMGVTRIDLRDRESLKKLSIVLRPEPSADALLTMEDTRRHLARKKKALAELQERYPAGERGQPAPELDGIAWFNTEARSLNDFRGRYVLLDFWFTGCGPCHYEFPSVKLIHEWFEKHGVTVIGVHDNSSTPEAVYEHCKQLGLTFPIVVDHPDGRILNAYQELGVRSFPSYILIGPDGNILDNDRTTDGPHLRAFKIEVVRKYVLARHN